MMTPYPYIERLLQADSEALSPRAREIQDYFRAAEEYNGRYAGFLEMKAQSAVDPQALQELVAMRAGIGEHFQQVQPLMEDLSYRLEYIPDPQQTAEYNRALREVSEYAFRDGEGNYKELRQIGCDLSGLEETARTAGVEGEWPAFALKFTRLMAAHKAASEKGKADGSNNWLGRMRAHKDEETSQSFEVAHYTLELVEQLENMTAIIASRLAKQEVSPEALEQLNAPPRTPEMRAAEERMMRLHTENLLGQDAETFLGAPAQQER